MRLLFHNSFINYIDLLAEKIVGVKILCPRFGIMGLKKCYSLFDTRRIINY
jgi:hypothetical protein